MVDRACHRSNRKRTRQWSEGAVSRRPRFPSSLDCERDAQGCGPPVGLTADCFVFAMSCADRAPVLQLTAPKKQQPQPSHRRNSFSRTVEFNGPAFAPEFLQQTQFDTRAGVSARCSALKQGKLCGGASKTRPEKRILRMCRHAR